MSSQNDNGQSIPATDPSLPQQQPPAQPQSAVGAAVAQTNVGGDSLTCQWQNCGERCATAEQLYVCKARQGCQAMLALFVFFFSIIDYQLY